MDEILAALKRIEAKVDALAAVPAPQKPAETGDGRPLLPGREYTPEEVSTLIGAFPGINEQQAGTILQYRTVQDAAEYLNGVMTKFGVTVITDIWHNAFQQLGPQAQFAGPFPWGPADVPATDGTE